MFGWLKKEEEVPKLEEVFEPPPLPVIEEPIIEPAITPLKSPGKYEDLNHESRSVTDTQECFDGLVVELTRTFGERFQIGHRFALGASEEPPTYNFTANWVGGIDRTGRHPPKTMLLTRVNTEGQLTGRFHRTLTDNLFMKFTGQTSTEQGNSGANIELDYEGSDWAGQFKWISPGLYGFTYHQFVTRRLSLGCDIFYRHQHGITLGSYGARYNQDKWVATGTIGPNIWQATYTQKVSDKVALATEMAMVQNREGNFEPLYTLGMEYRLRASTFRAHIDSAAKVFAHLEEYINPQMKIMLAAELDHKKKAYKFGMGLSLAL